MSNAPIKILMLDRAGAQSIWSLMDSIRSAAEALGHVVHTVRWDDGRGAQEDRKAKGSRDHILTVSPKRRPWDTLIQHYQFSHQFVRILEQVKPDILHANFIVPGGLGMRMARRIGVPRIITTRHELAGSLSPHLKLWSALSARYANNLIYVSKTVAQSYNCTDTPVYSGGQASRHMVIYNGIDLSMLSQIDPYPRDRSARVIVVAGRMVPVKGQIHAVEAFALAVQKNPMLRLELIGDGPDRAMLENRVRDAGLEAWVDFLGWRPLAETQARMKSAWRVIVPSDGSQEGFGLVLAEAMALGVPVIASDIPVFREVSAMGSGVMLEDCTQPQALADAVLTEFIETQAPSDKLDKAIMEKGYISLYQKLADK